MFTINSDKDKLHIIKLRFSYRLNHSYSQEYNNVFTIFEKNIMVKRVTYAFERYINKHFFIFFLRFRIILRNPREKFLDDSVTFIRILYLIFCNISISAARVIVLMPRRYIIFPAISFRGRFTCAGLRSLCSVV